MTTRLLFVHDNESVAQTVERFIRTAAVQYECRFVRSIPEAQEKLASAAYDLVVTDYRVAGATARELIAHAPSNPYLVLLDPADLKNNKELLRAGALHYLVKYADDSYMELLPSSIAAAVAHHRAGTQLEFLTGELSRLQLEKAQLADELQELRLREHKPHMCVLAQWNERYLAATHASNQILFDYDFAADSITFGGPIEAVLGFNAQELPTTRAGWLELVHPDDRTAFAIAEEQSRDHQGSFELRYRIKRKDSIYTVVQSRGRWLCGADGQPSRMIGFFADITELLRFAELERERNDLKQALKSFDRVLGVVGHELRTPLAGLRAMTEFILKQHDLNAPEARNFVVLVHQEIVRMAGVVNDLLEVARLNSGTVQWKWSTFRVKEACEAALVPILSLLDPTRVQLGLNVQPEELEMQGDVDAITRLVLNLITNSYKFTSEGEIRVTVTKASSDGEWVLIEVRDTGEGIPSVIAEKLGEPFALNAGIIGADYVGGSGLGLTICKGIVAAHSGAIEVKSAVGSGTLIRVRRRADLQRPCLSDSSVRLRRIGPCAQ